MDHGEAMEDDGEKLKSEVAAGKKQRARALARLLATHTLRERAGSLGLAHTPRFCAQYAERALCLPSTRAGARLRGGHGR